MSVFKDYAPLFGSYMEEPIDLRLSRANCNDKIVITIILSWKCSLEEYLENNRRLTRGQFKALFFIDQEDYNIFTAFLSDFNLQIISKSEITKYVSVKGRIGDFEQAFQIKLETYRSENGSHYLGRSGEILIPVQLKNIIEGVMGFDERPKAYAYSSRCDLQTNQFKGYAPQQVANVYGFPEESEGSDECIAILEFGGGYLESDLKQYFGTYNLNYPKVKWIGVNGAFNAPTKFESYDQEVAMNIQVAASIANNASVVVYYAPNTEHGFLSAIVTAVYDDHNCPTIISISWGAPETSWSEQAINCINEAFKIAAILGISICVATGNKGVHNGLCDGNYHVDFPASSPFALACGGTTLKIVNNKLLSEVAWFESCDIGSGGGISHHFVLPKYQYNANIPMSRNRSAFSGRGIPDVSGNANPETGYRIYVHGKWTIIGGTSSVAPLYAGLIARVNSNSGIKSGFLNPIIYSNTKYCRNIRRTANKYRHCLPYKLTEKWNAYTGLGVLSNFNLEHFLPKTLNA